VTLRTSRSLAAKALRWLDERTAGAVGAAEVRVGLIRIALRRRDNIPDLAVLALEQEGLGRRRPQLDEGQ
jgi:hypothetical protein